MFAAFYGDAMMAMLTAISIVGDKPIEEQMSPVTTAISGVFALDGMGFSDIHGVHHRMITADLERAIQKISGENIFTVELLLDMKELIKGNAEQSRKMMHELHKELRNMEKNMNGKFDELKAFIQEQQFTERTVKQLNSAFYWMQRTQEEKTKENVEQFISEFKKDRPQVLLKKFTDGLKMPSSNPIVAAMENKVLESKTIILNYTQLFVQMVGQVSALEGYYYGLVEAPNNGSLTYMSGVNRTIIDASVEYRNSVTNYKLKSELYWPGEVQKVLQSNMADLDPTEIADKIQRQLENIRTTDVFTIFAYNYIDAYQGEMRIYNEDATDPHRRWLKEFKWHDDKRGTQLIVLRSSAFHDISTLDLLLLKTIFRAVAYAVELALYNGDSKQARYYYPHHQNAFVGAYSHFISLPPIHGFRALNITPAVRYTNKGYPIIAEEDQTMLPSPRYYIGISWT